MRNIMTIDVEDWFHLLDVEGIPAPEHWSLIPSRLERNTHRLMSILDQHQVTATCFVIGRLAALFPALVRELHAAGHEIGSHGYDHRLVYEMGPQTFLEDARRARLTLEDIIGAPVAGYRASGFSVTPQTPWFFDAVAAAGYRYDSSSFPGKHGHGGLLSSPLHPHQVQTAHGPLMEFPITVVELFGKRLCFFGGGYLRLFPYLLIQQLGWKVNQEGRAIVFYLHPREIDPRHPQLTMPWNRRLKSYCRLETTEPKLKKLLQDFPVSSFREFLLAETIYPLESSFEHERFAQLQDTTLFTKHAA